jgi:hypothetical protein
MLYLVKRMHILQGLGDLDCVEESEMESLLSFGTC